MRLPPRRLPMRLLVTGALALTSGFALAQTAPAPPAVSGRPEKEVPTLTTPTVVTTESAPQPLGFESDVHCFGYLAGFSESFTARVNGAENLAEQTDYMAGDLLYVNGGYDKGLAVGDPYWLITPEQEVFHPVTGRSLGRLYQYRGRAEVYHVEPRTATIRVTHGCTDIPMGSYLKRFEPIPIPLARKTAPAMSGDPPSGKAKGNIVFTRDGVVVVGQDTTVIVDLGLANGIQPGDFLTIFRYASERQYGIRPLGSYWVKPPPPLGSAIPRTYLGEAAVMMVGDRWAIARLTDSYRLIEVGDEVELK